MNDDDFDEDFDDDPEDRSRNYDARPGYDLRDDVDLAGWDERSVWGYDTGTGSFYAQLWRNPGDNDAPDVWLSGVHPPLPWPGCVVAAAVDATGCDPLSVVRALGLVHPSPTLRPHPEITAAAAPPATDAYTPASSPSWPGSRGSPPPRPAGSDPGKSIMRRRPRKSWRNSM